MPRSRSHSGERRHRSRRSRSRSVERSGYNSDRRRDRDSERQPQSRSNDRRNSSHRRDTHRDRSLDRHRDRPTTGGSPQRTSRRPPSDEGSHRRPESSHRDRSSRRYVSRSPTRPTVSSRRSPRGEPSARPIRRFQSPTRGAVKADIKEEGTKSHRRFGPPNHGGPRGPRREVVNHEEVPPFMLRVLVKHGDWHTKEQFYMQGSSFEKMCEADEIQVYAWMDSNLRTVVELTQDVRDEDRHPQHSFNMRIVKFDESMTASFIELPPVHNTYRAGTDHVTLAERGFCVGDLIDICVTRGKGTLPGHVAINQTKTEATDTPSNTPASSGEVSNSNPPKMKDERTRGREDEVQDGEDETDEDNTATNKEGNEGRTGAKGVEIEAEAESAVPKKVNTKDDMTD